MEEKDKLDVDFSVNLAHIDSGKDSGVAHSAPIYDSTSREEGGTQALYSNLPRQTLCIIV